MDIPYGIDNHQYRLADVLNALLAGHGGRSLEGVMVTSDWTS